MKKPKGTYREVRGKLNRTQEMLYGKDFRRADAAYYKD